jgi:tRNA dimethylallyltransferase
VSGPAALIGPTASGKSAIAHAVARDDTTWELVTVDSMQVYRGMDIGTAKPTPTEQAEVPHHLLDLADPWDDHDLATYQAAARGAIADIERRGRRALLVGGTALYLRAVVDDLQLPGQYPQVRAELEAEATCGGVEALHARLAELDPDAAARMEPNNHRRVVRALEVTVGSGRPFSSFGSGLDAHPPTRFRLVGLRWDRGELDERIAARYRVQMDAGFLDEVRGLLGGSRPLSRSASQALGYKELAAHLAGECSLEEALDLAVRRTRRFARRQDRWFRRDPRIHWLDVTGDPIHHVDEVRHLLDQPGSLVENRPDLVDP